MVHTDILDKIKKEKQHVDFLYPYYGQYSIAEVGPTVLSLLGVKHNRDTFPMDFFPKKDSFKRVMLLMVDGFGYDHFQEYQAEIPFLNNLYNNAEVYPITSVFPSTTPAALTTMHTGLTPQEHGLPEWTVYFEEFGQIIETFPFKPIMTAEREILLKMGGTPEMLYKGSTVYQDLKDNNVPSYMFINHDYATSAYSRMTQRGSTVIPFINYEDLIHKLRTHLVENKDPGYIFVYWSHIDSTEHVFGPRSPEHVMSMQSFSNHFTNGLFKNLPKRDVEDVLFLMTADHGHTSIKGEDIIFLNNYLPLEKNLLHNPNQKSIQPTGSPHDVFLHIYPPRIPETLEFLKENLKGKAEVILIKDAIKRNLFGLNKPVPQFIKRIGDILILPYPGYHVWYKHDPTGHYGQRGIHGGLTEAEMVVPLVVAPLTNLL